MKNKKQTLGMYFEALRQVKTIGCTFAVIMALQLVVALISFRSQVKSASFTMDVLFRQETYDAVIFIETMPFLLIIGLIMIPAMFIQLYGWLGKRGESDFYHSLPVKRSTIFISDIMAVMTWALSLLAVSTLAGVIILSAIGKNVFAFDFSTLPYYLIYSILAGLMISGAMLIAKCLVSSGIVTVAVTAMILYFPRVFIYCFYMMVISMVPKAVLNDNFIMSMDINILCRLDSFVEVSWGAVLYSVAIMVLYFVIAAYLFINRKSETAGKEAVNKYVQATFRTVPAFTICLLPIYGISYYIYMGREANGYDKSMIICVYILAVFVYFFYELVSTRKISQVIKSASGLFILVGLNVLACVCVIGCAAYLEGTPIKTDEIESLSFESDKPVYGSLGKGPEGMIYQVEFTASEMISYVADKINSRNQREYDGYVVKVNIDDRTKEFNINADWDDLVLLSASSDFWNYITLADFPSPDELEIKDDQEYKLYELYYKDAKQLGDKAFAEKYKEAVMKYYEYSKNHNHDLYDDQGNNPIRRVILFVEKTFAIYITEDFPESYKYYLSMKKDRN